MPSIIEGYNYDIFISYRQKDNKYDGWVTEFVDNLKKELEATFKEEIGVYFDINPHDGLLETHDVDESLKDKLKCLVCIPIISRTYCDPKSFAWEHEFKAFIQQASDDKFGLKVTLPNGNVANRVLPVRIHDLSKEDIKLCESVIGGILRGIDFIYKSSGVNRPLRAFEDNPQDNLNKTYYRDQINKVANAIDEIIQGLSKIQPVHVSEGKKDIIKTPGKVINEEKKNQIQKKRITEIQSEVVGKEKKISSSKSTIKKPWVSIPVSVIILSVIVIGIWNINHNAKVKWAKEKALSEIEQYLNESDNKAAFDLVRKAEKYLGDESKFRELASIIVRKITILTDPPGADVFIREYTDIDGEWKKLGKTPIDSMKVPRNMFYQVKFEKEGYEDVLAVTVTYIDTLKRTLLEEGTIPPGMVYVEGYWNEVKNTFEKENGFFIDRYEVTNKQYKEFVDNGGYSKPEYWKHEFYKDGKIISREEAMAEFKDNTGRPGPSTWEASDYPDGQDDYPVSGVSWYEAAAYAEFAGKSLPTGDHWDSGVGFYNKYFYDYIGSRISPLSNFNGKGTEPVGKNMGVSCYGAYDMAGNVKEWSWNETQNGRITCGAAWDDPAYLFTTWSYLPPFDRSPENGFRCAKYIDKEKIPESAFRVIRLYEGRDFSKEIPVSEDIFRIYRNQFLYDNTALNAIIEERDESPRDWIVEKCSFNAAYGDEKMIAYLYLPRNASPPYQTLIFFPGIYAIRPGNLKDFRMGQYFFDFILKSGRAVIYPVYKGTFERNNGETDAITGFLQSHQYTQWLINWTKDFRKTIDYLETRPDIDKNKIGFIGHSWGGYIGGIIPAVEERIKVNILVAGGFDVKAFPEADQINYVPRIKTPVLMLNGKYDVYFPFDNTVQPFFDLLGTPLEDKRLCVYETDHNVPRSEMIKETLAWLDKYFGPVNYLQNK